MLDRRITALAVTLVLGSVLLILSQQSGTRLPGIQSVAIAGTMPPDQSTDRSATPSGQSGASNTAPAAAATPAPSGTVLVSDNFSSPAGGLFMSGSNALFTWGYVNGDYQIASVGPVAAQQITQITAGDYTDVTVAVDAHLGPNGDAGQTMGVGCRITATSSGRSGYLLRYNTLFGSWFLTRAEGGVGAGVPLGSEGTLNGTPVATANHHLVITCQGSTITASIDGQPAGSVQDAKYQHGSPALWAYSGGAGLDRNGNDLGGYPAKVDVRFDNFVLTQP